MKYRLVYTHRASKDILRLEQSVKQRIGKALEKYEEEPLKHASKLTDPMVYEIFKTVFNSYKHWKGIALNPIDLGTEGIRDS